MNKGKFRKEDGTLVTVPQMATEINSGRNTVMKLAGECHAVVRLGRSVRINREKFLKYVTEDYEG